MLPRNIRSHDDTNTLAKTDDNSKPGRFAESNHDSPREIVSPFLSIVSLSLLASITIFLLARLRKRNSRRRPSDSIEIERITNTLDPLITSKSMNPIDYRKIRGHNKVVNCIVPTTRSTMESYSRRGNILENGIRSNNETGVLTTSEGIRKRICILGSTGSIGTQTLSVCDMHPDKFLVESLSAGRKLDLLAEQILKYKPSLVNVTSRDDLNRLLKILNTLIEERGIRKEKFDPSYVHFYHSEVGLLEMIKHSLSDIVVVGLPGFAGFKPTVEAIACGKDVAVANKEAIVAGGPLVSRLAEDHNVKIIPLDSEHSAVWQCMQGNIDHSDIESITLTCSGGPFLGKTSEELSNVSVSDALTHPVWKMGPKISIDSATLMNKALEIIEAHWLFGLPAEKINVRIHREGVIHSMIHLKDGSTLAQLGSPDMRVPILYGLSYPRRSELKGSVVADKSVDDKSESEINSSNKFPPWILDSQKNKLNNEIENSYLKTPRTLTLQEINISEDPALSLAVQVCSIGGTSGAIVSAANEVAVDQFLSGRIKFRDIVGVSKNVLQNVQRDNLIISLPTYEDIIEADRIGRRVAEDVCRSLENKNDLN